MADASLAPARFPRRWAQGGVLGMLALLVVAG